MVGGKPVGFAREVYSPPFLPAPGLPPVVAGVKDQRFRRLPTARSMTPTVFRHLPTTQFASFRLIAPGPPPKLDRLALAHACAKLPSAMAFPQAVFLGIV